MKYQFPASWSIKSFKDVAEVITGTTPSTQCPEYYGGSVPFVGPAELGGAEPITQSAKWLSFAGAKQARLLPAESVLMCCIGATIGKVGFSGIELATNQQINALVFDKNVVHPKYAFHYCHTLKSLIRHMGASTTLPILPKGRFQEIEIPLPPLEEQRRIAAILDKADAVRRKRQSAIALTEELLRSAFLEMFGDPVTNPKGWKIVQLEQVCHRVTDGTHQSPEWAVEGIPFLFVSNIINGEIDFNVSKYISEESWTSLTARCPIEVNDILYTTVGSYGNAAMVRTEKRFCFQRHIAHIKPDTDKIHPEFFLGLMQSDGVRQQADRQVRGVAQKTLNLRELKNFQVAVPPHVYQEQYVALRRNVEGCLNNQQKSLEIQDNLFNSLIQKAFRGQL